MTMTMKVGASYYPELLPQRDWERDLQTARDLGLSCLRCGEFAWSSLEPVPGRWDWAWATTFLDMALKHDFEVIWCTPSATPPPALFDRWPDLNAVSVEERRMPVGIRRHYCPSHEGYRQLCAEVADRLARELGHHPAVVGWQVDNEIAGDGFTCWCPRCGKAFQRWLEARYQTIEALNAAWQTGFWSQAYTAWEQIPVPHKGISNHAPSLRLAYRRFRSDNWLGFYQAQAEPLRASGKPVTTNLFDLNWDTPADHWKWRPHMEAVGCSHYLDDPAATRFHFAVLNGALPGTLPVWVLEQRVGEPKPDGHAAEVARQSQRLTLAAEAGAQYAVYWHLRKHVSGLEQEHFSILEADGRPGWVGRAIGEAVRQVSSVRRIPARKDGLLVFSFDQHWAQEQRPVPGTRWDYRDEIEQQWHPAAYAELGPIPVGSSLQATAEHRLLIAPLAQIDSAELLRAIGRCLDAGGTFVTTVDFGRLDEENNIRRVGPLQALTRWANVPEFDVFPLKAEQIVAGRLGESDFTGRHFWAVPRAKGTGDIGVLKLGPIEGPAAIRLTHGRGSILVALTAPDRAGVAAMIREAVDGLNNLR
jgi:beta-galactosidase